MASIIHRPAEKREAYKKVASDLDTFFSKYSVDTAGRMATINSFLKMAFKHLVFVGFYTVKTEGVLQIGPYQGPVLATGIIAFGKGVCGTAAETGVTQVVADVSTCANYIPCDDFTRSEIVVPVFARNAHNEPDAPASADTPKRVRERISSAVVQLAHAYAAALLVLPAAHRRS
jgi:L-methionine (R)-S-oxide reductase